MRIRFIDGLLMFATIFSGHARSGSGGAPMHGARCGQGL
jgi:hypothetical protein